MYVAAGRESNSDIIAGDEKKEKGEGKYLKDQGGIAISKQTRPFVITTRP